MATRNITRKFIELRNGAKALRSLDADQSGPTGFLGRLNSSRDKLGGGSYSSDDDTTLLAKDFDEPSCSSANGVTGLTGRLNMSLPPHWVDIIDDVDRSVLKIQELIRELNIHHSDRLRVKFEDNHERHHEGLIESKTAEITATFRATEKLVKKFSSVATGTGETLSQAELSVRNNIQRALAKRIQVLSVQFRSSQKDYMSKLRTQQAGGGSTLLNLLDSQSNGGDSGRGSGLSGADGFSTTELTAIDPVEQLVNERDAEIIQIAQNIEELAAIFKELAAMVIDQGTVLDRIDYNMEQTLEHAKEGVKQLEAAEETQKASLAPRCIIILACIMTVLIIILILKHR